MVAAMTDDVLALHAAVTSLMRALKIAERDVQIAHRELNFVAADIATMRFVAENPGCKLSDLASHLGVVPTTASSVVDRLVDRGFVLRERPASNRRAVALTLSEAGAQAFGLIEGEEIANMQLMLEALDPAERPAFVTAMTKIAQSITSAPERDA